MRVLFVAPRFPYPPRQGDRLRAYELLLRLRRRHTITLVAPEMPDAGPELIDRLCDRWVPVRDTRVQALMRMVWALPGTLPFQTAYFYSAAMRRAVRALLADGGFDLLHLHTARVAPALEGVTIPVIIDLIDALSLNMRRRAERERPPVRWLFALEGGRMQRLERRLLDRCIGATVVSAPDRAALGDHPRLHVVPMGVDFEQFRYSEDGRSAATLVLSGRMAYFPNADAARFLAAEVLPLVRAELPEICLRIVGADPPSSVTRLADLPGVMVTGYVASVAEELQRTTIAVAPLRAGTGMQIKVVEAMAVGAPVVATPQVLAGIAAQDGEHALAGDTPAELAAQILRLLRDPALRLRLARAARRLVEERYSWERAADAFDRLYHTSYVRD